MDQISLQNSHGKMSFYGGFHGTPLGTNGSEQWWKYLGHLTVKEPNLTKTIQTK